MRFALKEKKLIETKKFDWYLSRPMEFLYFTSEII